MKRYIVILLISIATDSLCQTFEPSKGPLAEVNQTFHTNYNKWVKEKVTTFGTKNHPVMVLTGDSILFLFNQKKYASRIIPIAYHQLKAIDHLVLGLFSLTESWPEGNVSQERLEDLRSYENVSKSLVNKLAETNIKKELYSLQQEILSETELYLSKILKARVNVKKERELYAQRTSKLLLKNVEEAAKLQVNLLHLQYVEWKKWMDSSDFRNLHVVVASSHQARYKQLSLQYFSKVFNEPQGATALTENHVVAAEGIMEPNKCLDLLARHIIDQQIGKSFFGDKFRMQRDLLSDGASKYIDPLFE